MSRIYPTLGQLIGWVSGPISRPLLNRSQRCRVLIICEGQIVLVQNWLGQRRWSLPGGGLARGETPQQCAAREVREETGLRLEADQFQLLGSQAYPDPSGHLHFRVHYLYITLLQKPPLRRPRPHEIVDLGWFDLDDLPSPASPTLSSALELAGAGRLQG